MSLARAGFKFDPIDYTSALILSFLGIGLLCFVAIRQLAQTFGNRVKLAVVVLIAASAATASQFHTALSERAEQIQHPQNPHGVDLPQVDAFVSYDIESDLQLSIDSEGAFLNDDQISPHDFSKTAAETASKVERFNEKIRQERTPSLEIAADRCIGFGEVERYLKPLATTFYRVQMVAQNDGFVGHLPLQFHESKPNITVANGENAITITDEFGRSVELENHCEHASRSTALQSFVSQRGKTNSLFIVSVSDDTPVQTALNILGEISTQQFDAIFVVSEFANDDV